MRSEQSRPRYGVEFDSAADYNILAKMWKIYTNESMIHIVAKRDNAHCEQFLRLQQCFQRSFASELSETVCMRFYIRWRFGDIMCQVSRPEL